MKILAVVTLFPAVLIWEFFELPGHLRFSTWYEQQLTGNKEGA